MGERAVFYGTGDCAEVRAVQITELGAEGVSFSVTAQGERASVQLHLLGRHNVHNALAAIAVGLQQRHAAGGVREGAGRDASRREARRSV